MFVIASIYLCLALFAKPTHVFGNLLHMPYSGMFKADKYQNRKCFMEDEHD